MTPERAGWTYTLEIGGIFGRNRTVKRHTFTLLETSDEKAPTDATVLTLAKKTLANVKFRGDYIARVLARPHTTRDYTDSAGETVTIKTVLLFDPKEREVANLSTHTSVLS